jgi:hypothetical protein
LASFALDAFAFETQSKACFGLGCHRRISLKVQLYVLGHSLGLVLLFCSHHLPPFPLLRNLHCARVGETKLSLCLAQPNNGADSPSFHAILVLGDPHSVAHNCRPLFRFFLFNIGYCCRMRFVASTAATSVVTSNRRWMNQWQRGCLCNSNIFCRPFCNCPFRSRLDFVLHLHLQCIHVSIASFFCSYVLWATLSPPKGARQHSQTTENEKFEAQTPKYDRLG